MCSEGPLCRCTRVDVGDVLSWHTVLLILPVSSRVHIRVIVDEVASGVDTYLHSFYSAELLSVCHVVRRGVVH